MELNEIVNEISKAGKIAVMPHVSVDGDGLGSSLALSLALSKLGKKAVLFLEEEIPEAYEFLPGTEMIIVGSESTEMFDMVIALDTGDMGRLGKRAGILDKYSNTVNIDHHQTNTMFARMNYVSVEAAAVGEIIYQIVKMMGMDIDIGMATCLYVALATDTGGFKYSNTTSATHRITSELINIGVDVADISKRLFDTYPLERIRLMGIGINNMKILENGKAALIAVTNEMMTIVGAGEDDCNGLVNIGRSVEGVEVSAVLREKGENEIRVNLRSNTYVDVASIAGKLGGGGHKRAAGCTIKGDITEAEKMIMDEIKRVL